MTRWHTDPRPVKARKAHPCSWCGEDIERGEVYQTWTYGDPTPSVVRMHAECDEACAASRRYDDLFEPGTRARGCSTCEAGCCEDPDYCEARPSREN